MNQALFDLYLQNNVPIAWEAGVRFDSYNGTSCSISVTFGRMNQNPFGSMFWAVQGMAAEFAGGTMLLGKIMASEKNISSLVINSHSTYHKKATGKIIFTCNEGKKIDESLKEAVSTGSPTVFDLHSVGTNEAGERVADFNFTWSVLLR